MGSITKAPKAPAPAYSAPQVVYYTPDPAYTAPEEPAPDDPATPPAGSEEQKSESRTQSLLRRERGRLGTVLTGFRGLLGLSSGTTGQRKTLLGE